MIVMSISTSDGSPEVVNIGALFALAVTVTSAPRVGVGTGFCAPFMESARSESWAKPTEGGEALKTEYTFFCRERWFEACSTSK